MKLWPIISIMILICFTLIISGCRNLGDRDTEHLQPRDLIIPLNISEVLKHSETEVLAYFYERREQFESLRDYMLENEPLFQTLPVTLSKDKSVDIIQDPTIRLFAQRSLDEGLVTMISSSTYDPSKLLDISIDSDYPLYQQGIIYSSQPEMLETNSSILNYVKDYKHLSNGWYYYVYYYDNIEDEDQYRRLAWGRLSDETKDTLTIPRDKALVALEAGSTVAHAINNKELDFVVSVQFSTEMDGILGPITLLFNPATKQLVGAKLRF